MSAVGDGERIGSSLYSIMVRIALPNAKRTYKRVYIFTKLQ